MRRDELDLDAAVWTIPGGRTKSGRPVVVPLPPLAVRLLRTALANAPKDAVHVLTTRRRRGNVAGSLIPATSRRSSRASRSPNGWRWRSA